MSIRPTAMTPIAAYFMMIATDLETERRTAQPHAVGRRQSRLTRLGNALEEMLRLGRPTTTQPA
jgi:hypothetical protein